MTEMHWAVFALRDIKNALDAQRYDVASCHIDDAIAAILSRDAQDTASQPASRQQHGGKHVTRL